MKSLTRWVVVVLLTGATVACSGPGAGAASRGPGLAWERNLPAALTRASNESKLVMVDFYTDWCGWCDRMDKTTYADGRVQAALKAVVAVRLDAEREGRTEAERFGVNGYPMVIFLDAGGREVGRIPGYLPPEPFLEELDDVLRRV